MCANLTPADAAFYRDAMRRLLVLALVAGAAWPGAAGAAELTDVASSFDAKNLFDFRFRVSYWHREKRAQLKRELEGLPGQQTIDVFKDLTYAQHRDGLSLRAEVGLYKDLMLHLELPLILEEATSYAFDQSAGSGCVYPPAASPNCVNVSNSSTIADGIAPVGGFDARAAGMPLGGAGVLRGPLRGARGGSGLDAFDTVNLGLTWAPFSQARDDTKPTWTITAEGQISFGNIKAFDRAVPDANHAVSEGLHRIHLRTAVSKRFRFFEPYWAIWYTLQLARGDSLFRDYGRAQKTKDPQMMGGAIVGTEIIPLERPAQQYRVAIDLRGRLTGTFQGRGYSEAWELLAGSPALRCDASTAAYNPACDPAQPANPYQNQPFTGLTTIQNYATVGTDVAVTAQLGRFFQIRTGFAYTHDQPHLVTGEDIGTPHSGAGRVTRASEFNPAYRPVIDQAGRRYRVDSVHIYDFYLWAQLLL